MASRAADPTAFMLDSCLSYSFSLKLEATYSSETPVDYQRTAECFITEDRTQHTIVNISESLGDTFTTYTITCHSIYRSDAHHFQSVKAVTT
jgi:hypothetical protein